MARPDDKQPDRDLVAAVVAGEPGAYERLRERVARVVSGCLANVTGAAPWLRRHEPDLRQGFELMLVADDFRVLRSFAGRSALTTWIHVLATRYFRRQAGRLRAREAPLVEGTLPERVEAAEASPEAARLRREREELARAMVASLPDRDQVLLAMIYEQGLDSVEVARALGLSASGVRMRKARLLERLARRFEGIS